MTAPMIVRRDGATSHPWQAHCRLCRQETLHYDEGIGMTAANTRGAGNRLWELAMIAGLRHLAQQHGITRRRS